MTITVETIKDLREKTGCGMMDCKAALTEANGDFEQAVDILRKKGIAAVARRAGRIAAEGLIDSYIHTGGKIGVLVEVNCESDFVARNIEFQGFVKDICMQIAASNPQYLSRDEVPDGIVSHEKDILVTQAKQEAVPAGPEGTPGLLRSRQGKPEKAVEKIVEGRLGKFYSEICLLDQPFIKDPKKTIADLIGEIAAKIGEKIVIRRFTRYQLGEKA
ncbi:translation elongation factor Ts [Candidatus Saganbacteria bacterium]|uniref:Elongation factor Ts n=1 Tax=Candidatus Saganbacteria bacterium TaxID=2575572 RepID=A0A9D6YXS8_UNCSA|nr:translation elongation factor Ts [Candidatus Saganbacteria bacterium]